MNLRIINKIVRMKKNNKKVMNKKNKKAYFFVLDSIIAMTLIILIMTVAPTYYPKQYYFSNILAEDVLNTLSSLKIGDAALDNEDIEAIINTYGITDTNVSVLWQIAKFWQEGETDGAKELTKEMFKPLEITNKNIGLWIEGTNGLEPVYSLSDTPLTENTAVIMPARAFLSGTTTENGLPKMELKIIEIRIWQNFS